MSEENKKEAAQISRRKLRKVGAGRWWGGRSDSGRHKPVGYRKLLGREVPVILKVPESQGYLVVDTKKCAGCTSRTPACSMVHETAAVFPRPDRSFKQPLHRSPMTWTFINAGNVSIHSVCRIVPPVPSTLMPPMEM